MKRFLIKILIFSAIIFSLFSGLTFIVDKGMRKSEYGNLNEWSAIFDKKIDADVIIQGSSRAWVQFDTHIIDSVLKTNSYNMGMDGTPFDVQYVKYKALVKNNTYPKVILQNVDWDCLEKNEPVFQKYQLLPFLNNQYFEDIVLKNNIIPIADAYLPFLKYSGEPNAIHVGFLEFFGIYHYKSLKYKGFHASEGIWDGRNLKKWKKRGSIWKKNPDTEKLFINFLLDCKQKKIKVILVLAPFYKDLKTSMEDFDEMRHYYEVTAKKYNLIFLDYSLDSITYDKTNFYNVSHMNKKGAEAFSLKLANQLKSMNVLHKNN